MAFGSKKVAGTELVPGYARMAPHIYTVPAKR